MAPAMSNTSTICYFQEEKEHDEFKEDRMSELADDILLFILSPLGMKEATRTSILSKRWRYLSTNLTSLDFFDALETMEEDTFVNWVNQVVSLHRASSINDFRVCFPLNSSHANHINNWVEFASSKRVKNLVLDFSMTLNLVGYFAPYTLRLCANGLNFLSSLCLSSVNISEELLELLISRSHLLERLVVEGSHDLVHLKVINSSRLKYFAIRECCKLIKLVVDAVNLISIEIESYHEKMDVVYHNVSSLVEAKFGGKYCQRLLPNFREIACFSKHLTKLSLRMEMIRKDAVIPSFENVKHLDLLICVMCESKTLLPLRCFAEACPLLHEFKLQTYWPIYGKEKYDLDLEYCRHLLETKEEDGSSFTLPHLRKLEWVGCFKGCVDAELVLLFYIIKNANKLEKLICDPHHPLTVDTPFGFENIKFIEASRRLARQLAMVLPPSIDLVIV